MKPLGTDIPSTGSKASSQDERFPAALREDYFRIDERSPGQLLAYTVGFSKLVTFYNANGRPDGDWSPFFGHDPHVTLLLIRDMDTRLLRKTHSDKIRSLNQSSDPLFRQRQLWEIFRQVMPMLIQADQYFQAVKPFDSFQLFFSELITHRLSKVLQAFIRIDETVSPLEDAQYRPVNYLNLFSFDWFAYQAEETDSSPSDRHEALNILVRSADEQMHNLLYSLEELKREAARYIRTYVDGSGDMQPHLGLMLTFFDLMGKAQENINRFTGRHLEYYYSQVLRTAPLPASFGQTHVVFTLADGMPEQELAAGTLLTAGSGKNGEELLYRVVHPVVVNSAKISRMIAVECNHSWEERALLFGRDIPMRSCYQTGPGQFPDYTDDVETASAGTGFAISDGLLLQPEGDRKFSCLLRFTHSSFFSFLSAVRHELAQLELTGDVPPHLAGENQKINWLLAGALTVDCSSAGGWYRADPAKTELVYSGAQQPELRIDLLLEASEPAVTAVTDPGYPEALAAELPVFRFLLRRDDSPAYLFFRHLQLEKADLNVEVVGARQLLFRNDYGPAGFDSPFEMFGAQPLPGAAFYLGHAALLQPLYDLCLSVEWMDHPAFEKGFAAHYQGYDFIRNNGIFKTSVSALHTRRWLPAEDKQVFELFQDTPEGMGKPGSVSRITRLNNFDLDKLQLKRQRQSTAGTGPFTEADTAGFLKFEFGFPPNGFGHAEYPQLVNKVTQEAARRRKKEFSLPGEPYTPVVKRILLDYKVRRTLSFNGDGSFFYRHYPFGTEAAAIKGEQRSTGLLPLFKDGSTLHIGISGIGPGDSLSLLIKINDVVSSVTQNYPEVRWSILQEDGWMPVPPELVTTDETGGLKRSGITAFSFGGLRAPGPGLFDHSLWWLKIESNSGIPFTALLEDLYPNACLAALESGEPPKDHLPAGTITGLLKLNAAIATVVQPFASTGDRKAETKEEWYARVRERLRHRARALSSWDYEHLVLQQFPEVQLVKCIGHRDITGNIAPGDVLVAVLPSIEGADDLDRKGRFTQEKLSMIADFLRRSAPAQVNIHVVNPRYEKIKVKLRVKFMEGYDENFYLRKLNDDIRSFLDPWKEGSGMEAVFGASMSGFSILHFIEQLEYVDYVTNFNTFHLVEGRVVNAGAMNSGLIELIPASPVSILVSDRDHIITLHDASSSDSGGINDMMIGADFLLNAGSEGEQRGINYSRIGRDFQVAGDEPLLQALRPPLIKLKISV